MNKEYDNNNLLLPLGHISNSLPLALESIIEYYISNLTPMASRCFTCFASDIGFVNGSDTFISV